MMKRLSIALVLFAMMSLAWAEPALPTNVKWIAAYDAASGAMPATQDWTYSARNNIQPKFAEGMLIIDNDTSGGYFSYTKPDSLDKLDGDLLITARFYCLSDPDVGGSSFAGFFNFGICVPMKEGGFGLMNVQAGTKRMYCNVQETPVPEEAKERPMEITAVWRHSDGMCFFWLNGKFLVSRNLFTSPNFKKNSFIWGDGAGGIDGMAAIQYLRFGTIPADSVK